MAVRAKENLPGGNLKYLFVYLKIRMFKCSYRIYIYIICISVVIFIFHTISKLRAMFFLQLCVFAALVPAPLLLCSLGETRIKP